MQCIFWEGDYIDFQNFFYFVFESRFICDVVVVEVKFGEIGVFFQIYYKIFNIIGIYVFCFVIKIINEIVNFIFYVFYLILFKYFNKNVFQIDIIIFGLFESCQCCVCFQSWVNVARKIIFIEVVVGDVEVGYGDIVIQYQFQIFLEK